MRRLTSPTLVFGLLTGLLAFSPAVRATENVPAADGWSMILDLRFSEALAHFRHQQERDGESSDSARFGEAVAVLHRQPTTRANADEALAILEDLISESTNDAIVLEAGYLKARVIQLHPFDPDPVRAISLYLSLARRSPESILGQFAFVKASGLRLYAPGIQEDERPFESIQREAAFISDPDVRRSHHLLLAEASQRLGHDASFTLRHYLAAHAIGISKPDLRANVLIRIIFLSLALGDTESVMTHAEEFLEVFPRDIRITMVKELLEEKTTDPSR